MDSPSTGSWGHRPARVSRLGRWDALILGYAVLAAFARPLTGPAVVAVLAAAAVLVAVAVAVRGRPPSPAACPRRSLVPWLALAGLLAGWEFLAVAWGNDSAHPTLSLLLDPVLDTYPGRLVGYLAWLLVGRWLVTRWMATR